MVKCKENYESENMKKDKLLSLSHKQLLSIVLLLLLLSILCDEK